MILVGIGANLPGLDGTQPLDTARWAVTQLAALPGLAVSALSRWYQTEPIPASDQPPYINGVARLAAVEGSVEPDPASLLAWLQSIEARAGRVRGERDAARTLDLDIIAMGANGGMVRSSPDPVLPHPRAHLRAFVLAPLLEVAPDWVHPTSRAAARDLLAELPDQGITVL